MAIRVFSPPSGKPVAKRINRPCDVPHRLADLSPETAKPITVDTAVFGKHFTEGQISRDHTNKAVNLGR
jgi:hypothetical protein